MRRVGVFGGTFDPVHLGHLIGAEEARAALALDAVAFVPARVPPHKLGAPLSSAEHRLAMLELALAGNDRFTISRVDLDREGPHYTVDTLRILRERLDLAADDVLVFVMGADSLVDLPTWHRPLDIARQARLAVVDRPAYLPDLDALETVLPGIAARVDLVPMPLIGISASDIRRRVSERRCIRYQVPRAVERYIAEHCLYGPTAEDSAAEAVLRGAS